MSRGKRYNGEKQLNMKKVYSLIIIVVLIILFVFGIKQILKADKETLSGKNIELKYNTLYTNGNWGVINSSGDVVIQPAYAEMIIIPNKTKPVFVCTYEVNYVDGIYKTKIINEKNEEIYIGYENYFVIQNIDENNNLWVEENVIKVQKNGKYGLINIDGAEVLPCEYDSITAMKGIKNSLIIKKENLVGIVNSHGTIVVPVEYSDIASITKNYEDGYIVKNSESKFGVINQKGEVLVSCMYNEIKACTDGNMHIVKEGTTWKVILNNSTAYLEGKVANAVSINNGNVVINNNGKYGILNIEKGVMIPEEYQELVYMFEDKYIAKKDGKYGVIDLNNQVLVEFKYLNMNYNKQTDYIKALREDNLFDYIVRNLEVKLTSAEEEILDGFIKINYNNEIKYYNFKLEEKTNKDVYTSNTLFIIKNDGKYGFINKDGKTIVEPIYENAIEQNDYGYVAVKKDGKWGALDQYGNVVIEPTYVLPNNKIIDFIGKWHICADANANYYTDVQE